MRFARCDARADDSYAPQALGNERRSGGGSIAECCIFPGPPSILRESPGEVA
jgi:hypothetical protein